MAPPQTSTVLSTPAPPVSKARAEAIIRDHYGLDVEAFPLIGERDSNFRLLARDGREFLLKIVNPAEDAAVTDFQTEALLYIARGDADLPVPRVVRTQAGEAYFWLDEPGQLPRLVRVLTYLPGTPLAKLERGPALRRNLGAGLARLDLALQGFAHEGSPADLLWDLTHAPSLRPLVVHIEDEDRRALVTAVLDRLEAHTLPLTAGLRTQVIHNDFNPSNILVGPGSAGELDQLAGIIDFGDMVRAPLVNEVGVSASYHIGEGAGFLEPVKQFVAGYNRILPLQDEEIGCLFDLICGRMTLTAIITAWRCTLEPDNRDYILRNAGRAWAGLAAARSLLPNQAADEFHLYLSKDRLS
ncbi:phosphotransferase [Labrys sp. KNU-23]|uniref:phosphotransferase n=1 Tax=Labrys sp. KNU-23 TaxID=2789216 RepID=UPI00165C2D2A|nr:phosphotransferase [Labrys sp. KNU-23]